MLIGISGKARAGKNTVAEIFTRDHFEAISLAFELKWIAGEYFGWKGKKDEKGRKLLIDIGNKFREIDPDVWINVLENKHGLKFDDFKYIVTDIRYRNEAEWIRERGGILIRVNRPTLPDADADWRNTKSEMDLDDWGDWDYIINEDDFKTLKQKAIRTKTEILRRINEKYLIDLVKEELGDIL